MEPFYKNIRIMRDKNILLGGRWSYTPTFMPVRTGPWQQNSKRRIQALKRCYRRFLNISYKDHVTNEEVRKRIQNATGVHDGEETETQMIWPHLKIFWHGKDNSAGESERKRRRGRQKKIWEEDNIINWTGMEFGDSLRAAEDRKRWKSIVATSSVVSRRPSR